MNAGVLPIKFDGEHVFLLDQRALPETSVYFEATGLDEMCFAIKDMVVRGAPSIGVAAAFGLAMAARRLAHHFPTWDKFLPELRSAGARLAATRPTAVNLSWAIDRLLTGAEQAQAQGRSVGECQDELVADAEAVLQEHIEANYALSRHGAGLLPPNSQIITHCNAGSLATCGWGTALGVIRYAFFTGSNPSVFVDETRPRHQGSKLTMWELQEDHIPCTLICDSMSGHVMKTKKVDLVITGADRIAANGDSANKIGTYNLAVLARHHGIPFYIAAPLSTFDASIRSGAQIPIEERAAYEVTTIFDRSITIAGASVYNPAFDVTPAELITAIVTEYGVLRAPYEQSIAQAFLEHGKEREQRAAVR